MQLRYTPTICIVVPLTAAMREPNQKGAEMVLNSQLVPLSTAQCIVAKMVIIIWQKV